MFFNSLLSGEMWVSINITKIFEGVIGMDKRERATLQENILADLGCLLGPHTNILDVGCGAGGLVMEYSERGYSAYGCDLKFKEGEYVPSLEKKGLIRLVDSNTFEFPFEDNKFDVVVSDQVLEHVGDHLLTFKEIHRVLKPGGISLHIFPSCYMPIEPHVYVPFATMIQKKWWLYLWAILGVRTKMQRGLSALEVAEKNYEYLRDHTNYITKSQIVDYLQKYFINICFCEELFLKYSRRGKILYHYSKLIPLLTTLYGALRNRVIVFWKE